MHKASFVEKKKVFLPSKCHQVHFFYDASCIQPTPEFPALHVYYRGFALFSLKNSRISQIKSRRNGVCINNADSLKKLQWTKQLRRLLPSGPTNWILTSCYAAVDHLSKTTWKKIMETLRPPRVGKLGPVDKWTSTTRSCRQSWTEQRLSHYQHHSGTSMNDAHNRVHVAGEEL